MRYLKLFFLSSLTVFNLTGQDIKLKVEEAKRLIVTNNSTLTLKLTFETKQPGYPKGPVFVLPGPEIKAITGDYTPKAIKELRLAQTYDTDCFFIDLARWRTVFEASRRNLIANLDPHKLQQQARQSMEETPALTDEGWGAQLLYNKPLSYWLESLEKISAPSDPSYQPSANWRKTMLALALELDKSLREYAYQNLSAQLQDGLNALIGQKLNIELSELHRGGFKPQKAVLPNLSIEVRTIIHRRFNSGEKMSKDYKDIYAEGFGTRAPLSIRLWYRDIQGSGFLVYERSPLLINEKDVEGGYLSKDEGLSWTFLGIGLGYSILYKITPRTFSGLYLSISGGVARQKKYELEFESGSLHSFEEIEAFSKFGISFEAGVGIEVTGVGVKGGLSWLAYGNPNDKKKGFAFLNANIGLSVPLYKFTYE